MRPKSHNHCDEVLGWGRVSANVLRAHDRGPARFGVQRRCFAFRQQSPAQPQVLTLVDAFFLQLSSNDDPIRPFGFFVYLFLSLQRRIQISLRSLLCLLDETVQQHHPTFIDTEKYAGDAPLRQRDLAF